MQRKLTVGTYQTTNAFRQIGEHCAVIVEKTKGLVAITGPSNDPISQKDARLFAAAPDLLAACEWALPYVERLRDGRILRDAIAKAKGESQ